MDMKNFIEKAEKLFFKNNGRSDRTKVHDQEKWTNSCYREVCALAGEIKNDKDLLKLSDEELFNHIVMDRLRPARNRIAKDIGQKDMELGRLLARIKRVKDEREIVKNAPEFYIREELPYAHQRKVEHMCALDRERYEKVSNILIENGKITKETGVEGCSLTLKGKDTLTKLEYAFFNMKVKVIMYDDPGIRSDLNMDGDCLVTVKYPDNYTVNIDENCELDRKDVREKVGGYMRTALTSNDPEKIRSSVAKARYNMIVSNYFPQHGTSSVTDMLEITLYKARDYVVFPRKGGDVVSRDVKCFLYPTEDMYNADYLKDFKKGYEPTHKDEFTRAKYYEFNKHTQAAQIGGK